MTQTENEIRSGADEPPRNGLRARTKLETLGGPGPTMQEILDREQRAVPAFLRSTSWFDQGDDDISIDRYIERDYYDRELQQLWPKVWQFVCREEDIPDAGDTYVYDVARYSILIVRDHAGGIKAYPNACLHRGTKLLSQSGNVPELRCPFHGFCWSLEGDLSDVPCSWDFPTLKVEEFGLPECQVATLDGFVFVNMDPEAPGLEEYLGDAANHLKAVTPRFDKRFKTLHASRLIRGNWKVSLEAFLEGYHSPFVHPQTLVFVSDANSQYDIYPGQPHWSRMIMALGVPSPSLGELDEQDICDALEDFGLVPNVTGERTIVPDGMTAREVLGKTLRELFTLMAGYDASGLTDCEVFDNIQYFAFPNVLIYTSLTASIIMQFRPYGSDPEVSIMDLMFLHPVPAGIDPPVRIPVHELGFDSPWREINPAMEVYLDAVEQDMVNIPLVQQGLHTTAKPGTTPSTYQEARIRHFNRTLDSYVGR